MSYVFFFNDTATTEIYTLSLHDALPISARVDTEHGVTWAWNPTEKPGVPDGSLYTGAPGVVLFHVELHEDRKSTRLNSSHANISYAVFCLTTNYSSPSTLSISLHFLKSS